MKAPNFWQTTNWIATALKPLSWLYQYLSNKNRRSKLRHQKKLPVPLIVVGNINVGGTGKTPVTIALITALQAQGFRVGLISRGYGRKSEGVVVSDSVTSAEQLGDEPFLIHEKTNVPVAVGSQRYDAGMALLSRYPDLNLIISDDGLQHYALYRDFEIAVFGQQGIGNGCILPAGPLREPVQRLESVDAILTINDQFQFLLPYSEKCYKIAHRLGVPYQLNNSKITQVWGKFSQVSAIAGIAHPSNFFNALSQHDITVSAHPFDDHHIYRHEDFANIAKPIVMTEKDAVKCRDLLVHHDVWVVPLETELPTKFIQLVQERINLTKQDNQV